MCLWTEVPETPFAFPPAAAGTHPWCHPWWERRASEATERPGLAKRTPLTAHFRWSAVPLEVRSGPGCKQCLEHECRCSLKGTRHMNHTDGSRGQGFLSVQGRQGTGSQAWWPVPRSQQVQCCCTKHCGIETCAGCTLKLCLKRRKQVEKTGETKAEAL